MRNLPRGYAQLVARPLASGVVEFTSCLGQAEVGLLVTMVHLPEGPVMVITEGPVTFSVALIM